MLTPDYPSFTRSQTRTQYISGVTGRTLPSSGITIRYWARHMRERVKFLECIKTVQAQLVGTSSKLGGAVFIDVGPSGTLKKMISRYQWDGLACEQSDVYFERDYDPPLSHLTVPLSCEIIAKSLESTVTSGRLKEPIACSLLETTRSCSDSESLPDSSRSRSLSPPPVSPIPSGLSLETASETGIDANDDAVQVCLGLLSRLFGYPQGNIHLLQETFNSLGLGSLDFVQLQSEFEAAMGVTFPPSSYASEQPILRILQDLK